MFCVAVRGHLLHSEASTQFHLDGSVCVCVCVCVVRLVPPGTNITIVNDSVIDGRHPPPAAWAIMNSSGAPALPWSDEPPPVIPVPPAGPPPTPPPTPPTPPSPTPPAPPAPPGKTPCPPKGSPSVIGNYTSFPHTLGAGPDLLGKNATFFCASKGTCCAELSAELCGKHLC